MQKYNWEVPATWSDLTKFATRTNGTEDTYAVCLPWCSSFYNLLYLSMMANYLQVGLKEQISVLITLLYYLNSYINTRGQELA